MSCWDFDFRDGNLGVVPNEVRVECSRGWACRGKRTIVGMSRIPLGTPRMGRPYLARGQGVAKATHAAPGYGFVRVRSPWKGDRGVASERRVSFPQITLVEFDLVFLEQSDEFILVGLSMMVLRLIGNV